jgi:hypothetical protein
MTLHDNHDQLVDEHTAATILHRKVPTLRKDRWAGTGVPFIKIGRSVRYSVKDLRDYIAANRVHSTTQAGM